MIFFLHWWKHMVMIWCYLWQALFEIRTYRPFTTVYFVQIVVNSVISWILCECMLVSTQNISLARIVLIRLSCTCYYLSFSISSDCNLWNFSCHLQWNYYVMLYLWNTFYDNIYQLQYENSYMILLELFSFLYSTSTSSLRPFSMRLKSKSVKWVFSFCHKFSLNFKNLMWYLSIMHQYFYFATKTIQFFASISIYFSASKNGRQTMNRQVTLDLPNSLGLGNKR